MRLGLIARADSRGLGLQTRGFYQHLKPAKTLVVDMGDLTPYRQRFDWYPDAQVAPFDGHMMPNRRKHWLLDGIDVLLSAETFYDWSLVEMARERGIATALQYNWEFYRWTTDPEVPLPDCLISPSTWNLHRVPDAVHLPFPVDREAFPFRLRTKCETFLHVAGHAAIHDRNGTALLMDALRFLREPCRVLVRSQSSVPAPRQVPDHVSLEVVIDDIDDHRELWSEGDVAVMPRRYGGQSLPMNEALSCGMPIISLDMEPQKRFLPPEGLIPASRMRRMMFQSGKGEVMGGTPRDLAMTMDRFVREPELVERLSLASDAYAETISWTTLLPVYRSLLEGLTVKVSPV